MEDGTTSVADTTTPTVLTEGSTREEKWHEDWNETGTPEMPNSGVADSTSPAIDSNTPSRTVRGVVNSDTLPENWCEKVELTIRQLQEDAQAAVDREDTTIRGARNLAENQMRQFLTNVNVRLVQIYGMPLLQEAGITPTSPDFFNNLPLGEIGDDEMDSQIGMTMSNCRKLKRIKLSPLILAADLWKFC